MTRKVARPNNKKNPAKSSTNNKENEEPTQTPSKKDPPFALVLYKSGEKGVIEAPRIEKKCRIKGSQCMAPNPLGYSGDQDGLYEATVIEFGFNIQYLYDLPLLTDGSVGAAEKGSIPEAKKKKAENLKVLKEKNFNLKKIDSAVAAMPTITGTLVTYNGDDEHFDLEVSGDEDVLSLDQRAVTSLKSSSANKDLILSDDEPSSSGIQSGAPAQSRAPSSSKDLSFTDESFSQSKCPVQLLLDQASPANLEFLNQCTPNNLEFLGKVLPALLMHRQEKCPVASTCTEAPSRQATLIVSPGLSSQQKRKRQSPDQLSFDIFECSKDDTETKFPLTAGIPVYVLKYEYSCIPPLEGAMTSEESSENKQSSSLLRPKQAPLTTKGMVNHLVDMLVPSAIKGTSTAQILPKNITDAINVYINKRLPESQRVKSSIINKYITDRCRMERRDRATEAVRRDAKIATGQGPTKRKKKNNTLAEHLQNNEKNQLEDVEIVQLDGTILVGKILPAQLIDD